MVLTLACIMDTRGGRGRGRSNNNLAREIKNDYSQQVEDKIKYLAR